MSYKKLKLFVNANLLLVFLFFAQITFTIYGEELKEKSVKTDHFSSESNPVFDQEQLKTYSLVMNPEDWEFLQENIIKEQYVPAKLYVDKKEIGTVGVRYKGSTFTLEGCAGLREGERCNKISMKIKFNKYDKNLRYHGLKRLNFNSMMYDPSALRERLAYSIFTDMDVITSRACHARIDINGEYRGLFSLVEQIDDVFIKRNFPEENNGSLVKEKWPVTSDTLFYQKAVKVGDKKIAGSEFVNLFNELNDYEESKLTDFITERMDADYLMRYMAVDRAISNWDGVTAFYPVKNEQFKGFASHNYYWYKESNKSFFWLLPWDLDGTMTVNTAFDHVPEWNEFVKDTKKTYSIFDGETQAVAPTSDKLMRGFALLGKKRNRYKKAMKQLLDGPFKEGYLEEKIDKWANQISPYVKDDKFGPPEPVWQNAVMSLRDEIVSLRTRLKNRIDETEASPFIWSYDQHNGFEDTKTYDFHLGVYRFSNLKSCVRLSINSVNPISGKNDMRADFDMYNDVDNTEEGAYSQCVWIGSTFGDNREIDFKAKKIVGIKFTAFSDKDRQIWASIKSAAYLKDEGGCVLGSYADITTTPKTIEFYFKDGEFPFWMAPLEEFSIDKILSQVTNCDFSPVVKGLQKNGIFKEGDHDKGFVQIDDISFIFESDK